MGHLPRCRSTGIKYTKSPILEIFEPNPQSRYLKLSKSHSIFHNCIWFRTSLSPKTYCRLFQIQGSLTMAFNLLSRSSNSSIITRKQNIAIAEIVIYSLIHVAQFSTRCMQEWRYWHHNKSKSNGRCVFYFWWSMVGFLLQSKWKTFRQFQRYGIQILYSSHSRLGPSACQLTPGEANAHCGIHFAKRGPFAPLVWSQLGLSYCDGMYVEDFLYPGILLFSQEQKRC